MRRAASLFRRNRFARLVAVTKACELLLDDAYGTFGLVSFRIEVEDRENFDDLVETRRCNAVTTELRGWQIKQQTTELSRSVIEGLLGAAHTQTDLARATLAVAESISVDGVGPLRALRDLCQRFSSPGATPDAVIDGSTQDEQRWLALATGLLGSRDAAAQTLSRFAIEILGDEHAVLERARAYLPGLYFPPVQNVLSALESLISSIDGASLVTAPLVRSNLAHLRSQERTSPPAVSRETHRARYLSAIKAQFSRTAALATIPGSGLHLQARLTEVYVSRRLRSDTESRSLLDWLREPSGPGYLILGEVGSGKSALLLESQHLAACEAELDSRAPLPLLVRARDLRSGSPSSVIASALQIPVETLDYLVMDPLTRWLLLVDGADEIADGAWPHIERFARQLQGGSLLAGVAVTARPVARLEQTEYRRLLLEPWNAESLEDFLARWRRIQPRAVTALTGATYYENLRNSLLFNPLMATLCLLLAEHGDEIPQNRTRVFVEVLEILFEGWRRTRHEPPPIQWHELAPVLGRLANDYLRDGEPGISVRALKDAIRSAGLEPVLSVTDEAERELGVLISRPDGNYDFVFRSFAEHLAAMHVYRERQSIVSLAYHGWSEEVARHALGLTALNDEAQAESILRQLVAPFLDASPSEESIHLRPLLVALRVAVDLEHCISTAVTELAAAATRALVDEYSCWVGDRVAEELRHHARRGSALWRHCFESIVPHIAGRNDLFRWYAQYPPSSDKDALLALRHREPSIRALAMRCFSAEYPSANPMVFVHEIFDNGLEMGAGLPVPAVSAGIHLRGVARDRVPGLERLLERLLELDHPLLSGAAALALRPTEAPPARLAHALRELATHGYPFPPEPLIELEATEAGARALREIWPDRALPAYAAYLLSETTPLPQVRPASPSVVLRVIGCLEHGLHSLSHDLLRQVVNQRTPPGDLAVCRALLEGDPRLADPELLPVQGLEPATQRVLGRAAQARPEVARALLDAWQVRSCKPSLIGSLPGLALEPLLLDGNREALSAYVRWLEEGRLGGTNHVLAPDRRVLAMAEVAEVARRVVRALMDLVLVGTIDRTGRHTRYALGAVANAFNSLSPVWSHDATITTTLEEWLGRDNGNDYRAALRCFDGASLDPELLDRIGGEVLRKIGRYLAGGEGRYAFEALQGIRWLERNQLVARREVFEVMRSSFGNARTRAAAIAVAIPFLSHEEAASLSTSVAPHAVNLDTEYLTDVELLRLVGSAPDAWAEAVTSFPRRAFFPDLNIFRTVRALPPAQQIGAARALYQYVSQWELPWIQDARQSIGRPADVARMILFDAGLDLRS